MSCTDDGSTDVVNSDEFRKIIFSDNQNKIYSYNLALKSTSEINIKSNGNDYLISNKIEQIRKFGNDFFLLIPESGKILIVDSDTYNLIDEINFDSYEPFEIAFAENATSAYVIHKNADVISVIDLTVNEYVFDITENISKPSDIKADGNIVAVTNYSDNSLSVFSAIDESLISKFDVTPRPVSLEIMNTDRNLLVISAGYGKDSDDADKSPAAAEYFDIDNNESTAAFNITYGTVSPENAIPGKSINSYDDFTLIIEQNSLLFINGYSRKDARMFFPESFSNIIYDITDNLVYTSKITENGTYIYSFTPSDNQIREDILIPHGIISFIIDR